jgi:hypothetical protein
MSTGGDFLRAQGPSDTLGHFRTYRQNSAPKVFPPGGGRKIATIGPSDTVGHFRTFPQMG